MGVGYSNDFDVHFRNLTLLEQGCAQVDEIEQAAGTVGARWFDPQFDRAQLCDLDALQEAFIGYRTRTVRLLPLAHNRYYLTLGRTFSLARHGSPTSRCRFAPLHFGS
jgi:hypothetical protein